MHQSIETTVPQPPPPPPLGGNKGDINVELRFCNTSGRMGTVTICEISGDFLWAVAPAMAAGLGQSKQALVSLLQLLKV